MSKIYKHIFFDLDRTLWDFDRNTAQTLIESLEKYQLHAVIPDFDLFISTYHRINIALWTDYRKGLLSKDILRTERFYLTLKEFGIDDREKARLIGDDYLEISPNKTLLYPHAIEVLEYLSPKYKLSILSNGFQATQETKMASAGLDKYFIHLITSEKLGFHKPDIRIFEHAMKLAGVLNSECLMVGDDLEVDILGARGAGIDQVYFNPVGLSHAERLTHEITSLAELLSIL